MAHSFHVSTSKAHLKWNNAIPPVLTIPSGTEVTFDLKDGLNNQIRRDNADTALSTFDFSLADPAFGPVHITGAEPGDILQVDVLALVPAATGVTAIFNGFGLLTDDFPEQHIKLWDLSDATSSSSGGRAVFKPGISVPLRPFLGVMGIAPAAAGDFSTIPPYALSGGNMDTRDLGVGAKVLFPVQVAGALFSCGDGHAAQGDGEVCGTAIEVAMQARLRFSVVKKGDKDWMELKCPHYVTPPAAAAAAEEGRKGAYAALGIHADPREAARMALRGLLDWLVKTKGLTRVEAYMLASVAASLRMSEVVDMPNYAISCSIPLNTFDQD